MILTVQLSDTHALCTEASRRSIKTLPRVVQVSPVVPSGAGIEAVELYHGGAFRALVDFRHRLSADGPEVLVPAELNRKLTCDVRISFCFRYSCTRAVFRCNLDKYTNQNKQK